MAPGAGSDFGASMLEPEVFRKQKHCIEERTCDTVGSFGAPRSDFGSRRIVPPCRPSLRPCSAVRVCGADLHNTKGRNEVRWRLGQDATLAPPYLNLKSYGSKLTVLKEVFVTLLDIFGAPRSHSAPPWWFGARGIAPLAPARYDPAWYSSICNRKISGWVYCWK